jgi:hypothetical protein
MPMDYGLSSSSNQQGIIDSLEQSLTPLSDIQGYYEDEVSEQQILVRGSITRILADDTEGSRHQRFIIKLENNQTLLVAHNIDIGRRVADIAVSGVVYIFGQYEWNDEGGIIHWTHVDPDGDHIDGYIIFNGVKYQ